MRMLGNRIGLNIVKLNANSQINGLKNCRYIFVGKVNLCYLAQKRRKKPEFCLKKAIKYVDDFG